MGKIVRKSDFKHLLVNLSIVQQDTRLEESSQSEIDYLFCLVVDDDQAKSYIIKHNMPPSKPKFCFGKCSNISCVNMESTDVRFKVCAVCKQERYCSTDCQKAAW